MSEQNINTGEMSVEIRGGDSVELTEKLRIPLEMSRQGGIEAERSVNIKRGTIGIVDPRSFSPTKTTVEVSFPSLGVSGTFFVARHMLRKFVQVTNTCQA